MENSNEGRSPLVWLWLLVWIAGTIGWLALVLPIPGLAEPLAFWSEADPQPAVLHRVLGFDAIFGAQAQLGAIITVVLYFATLLMFLGKGMMGGGATDTSYRPSRLAVVGVGFPAALITTGLLFNLLEPMLAAAPEDTINWMREGSTGRMLLLPVFIGVWWVVWSGVFWVKWRGGTRLAQMYRITVGFFWASVLSFALCAALVFLYSQNFGENRSAMVLIPTAILWAIGAHVGVALMQNRYLAMTNEHICSFCGAQLSAAINRGETHCPSCSKPIPAWARPVESDRTAGAEPAAEPAATVATTNPNTGNEATS